jgi:hypothetical protein
MRWGTSYAGSALTRNSLFPFLSLLLMPLIVAVLTVAFLGYAVWRLAYLLWRLTCLAWQAIRARVAHTSRRATTYP